MLFVVKLHPKFLSSALSSYLLAAKKEFNRVVSVGQLGLTLTAAINTADAAASCTEWVRILYSQPSETRIYFSTAD